MTRPLSPQQTYYSHLTKQLAAPFNGYKWQFSGFPKWCREARAGSCEDVINVEIVPDAFAADETTRTIYALEVVDSSDITDDKAERIANAFWLLDEAEWELEIVLFYPKYSRTMIVRDLITLDSRHEDFTGRSKPWRDAFTVLKEAA